MAPNWFIALPVRAGEWHRSLVAPEAVRVFGEHDLHITVAFLGAVPEDKALAAWTQAQTFEMPALDITLSEVVALGNPRRPSAFSALLGQGCERVQRAMGEARERMWQAADARQDTPPTRPRHVRPPPTSREPRSSQTRPTLGAGARPRCTTLHPRPDRPLHLARRSRHVTLPHRTRVAARHQHSMTSRS